MPTLFHNMTGYALGLAFLTFNAIESGSAIEDDEFRSECFVLLVQRKFINARLGTVVMPAPNFTTTS